MDNKQLIPAAAYVPGNNEYFVPENFKVEVVFDFNGFGHGLPVEFGPGRNPAKASEFTLTRAPYSRLLALCSETTGEFTP